LARIAFLRFLLALPLFLGGHMLPRILTQLSICLSSYFIHSVVQL